MSKKKRNTDILENQRADSHFVANKTNSDDSPTPDDSSSYDDFEERDYDALPDTDNKRWELDENPIIRAFRDELRYRLNARGVEEVTGWLRMAMGKNVALSNLNQQEINFIVVDAVTSFNKEILTKSRKWGCSKEDIEPLSRWLENAIYFHLKRAFNDGERKYRKDSYGYNETYSHDEVRHDEIGGGGFMGSMGRMFAPKRQRRREVEAEDEY